MQAASRRGGLRGIRLVMNEIGPISPACLPCLAQWRACLTAQSKVVKAESYGKCGNHSRYYYEPFSEIGNHDA